MQTWHVEAETGRTMFRDKANTLQIPADARVAGRAPFGLGMPRWHRAPLARPNMLWDLD